MLRIRWIYIIFILFIIGACSKDKTPKVNNEQHPDTTSNQHTNKPVRMKITLADPTIYFDSASDMFYLYGTSASEVVHSGFKVFSSNDLMNWQRHDNLALSKGDTYGTDDFWAPQVFKHNGKYYMAYVANQHVAIAHSNSPLGPFKQTNKMHISDTLGVGTIDPYVFFDSNGDMYLYYVRFIGGNKIYVAKLKKDLSDIDTATVTFCISADVNPQPWENVAHSTPITEGPTVIKHEGLYYLFYSANNYQNPNYAVGYATSKNPMGPWTKYSGNPILYKDLIGANGPGHGDMFQDKNGQYYYVFHTHYSKYDVQPRCTAIIKGKFTSEGNQSAIFKFDKNSFRYLTIKQ